MNPSLVAVFGPFQGSTYSLDDPEITIGRHADNSLNLADALVSRHHCTIRKDQGGYIIADTESHNGILVNGSPVKEARLQHGDKIAIGGSLFLFLLGKEGKTPSQILLDTGTITTLSEMRLKT